MEQTSHIGELVFIGRNSERSAAASGRVGFTASTALQVVRQTLLVCPPEYRSIERLLIALSADLEEDARLTALAGTWAALFDVPVRISVIGRGRKYAAQCLDAARRTLDACRLELVSEGNFTRPEDFADELPPSDLLLVGRNRRPVVEQLALQVACPIAALARPDS
jgi:hypothetical protein